MSAQELQPTVNYSLWRYSKDVLPTLHYTGEGHCRGGGSTGPVEVRTRGSEQSDRRTPERRGGMSRARVDRNHAVSPLQKRQEGSNGQIIGDVMYVGDPGTGDDGRIEAALRPGPGE